MNRLFAFLIAYLFGCFPSAYLISQLLYQIDIREHGSGNPGTTNMLRVFGKNAAILTAILDVAKAFLAVFLVKKFGKDPVLTAYACLGAVIGHDFSIFLKFRGGKGIACLVGAVGAYKFIQLLYTLPIAAMILCTGYMSVASLSFVLINTIAVWMYDRLEIKIIFLMIAIITFYRHKSNIRRLMEGQEHSLFKRRS